MRAKGKANERTGSPAAQAPDHTLLTFLLGQDPRIGAYGGFPSQGKVPRNAEPDLSPGREGGERAGRGRRERGRMRWAGARGDRGCPKGHCRPE